MRDDHEIHVGHEKERDKEREGGKTRCVDGIRLCINMAQIHHYMVTQHTTD